MAGFDGPQDPDFSASGLKASSLVRLGFLAVLPISGLLGAIGSISEDRHKKIERLVHRMRTADQALGWFLILLGCIHNFVAAPMIYGQLSSQALWFASAGLALWYAGFLNLLRVRTPQPSRLLVAFCLLTNLSLLAFVLTFALIRGSWAAPQSVALIGAVALLTVRSAQAAFGRGHSP